MNMLEYQIVFPDQTVMDISIPSDSDILQRACAFFDKEDVNEITEQMLGEFIIRATENALAQVEQD